MSSTRSSPIIAKLEADLLLASEQRADIVDNFWKNNKFPLVEPIADDENNVKYTFLLQRDAIAVATQDRYLISDHRFGSPIKVTDDELLNNVNGTDINYVTMILPADARFRYGFVEFPKDTIKDKFAQGDAEYSKLQKAATYIGLKHPELVSNVISQSGAFWTDSAASGLILRKEMPADLQKLEGSAKTAFVLVNDALFFVDKPKNTSTPIPITSQQLESLKKDLEIKPLEDKAAVIKFNVMPLHIMQRFEALTPTPLAPKYKMMEAIESFAAKQGATQIKLQAGLFEDSVNTQNGTTTNNNDLDSLLTRNKALNVILQNHGIKSDFSAACYAHTSDGCEATLAKPLESVLRSQPNVSLSSTAAIHQLARMQIAPVQAMQTPAPEVVKAVADVPTTVIKAPAPKVEEKDVTYASPRPHPGK